MSRKGNLNPTGFVTGSPNWCPLSTTATIHVSTGITSQAVPSGARGVLFTANVDTMVGLSTLALTASAGTLLKAGDMWPGLILPVSTGKFKLLRTTTTGLATFCFLTHRSLA